MSRIRFSKTAIAALSVFASTFSVACGLADGPSSGENLQRLEGEQSEEHARTSEVEFEEPIGPAPQLDPAMLELPAAVDPDKLEEGLLEHVIGPEGVDPDFSKQWVASLLNRFDLSSTELLRASLAIAQRSENVGFFQLQTLTVQIVLHHSNTPEVRAELVWLYENAEAVAMTALALKGERAQRAAEDLQLVFQRGSLAVLIPYRDHERVKPLFEHAASSGIGELERIADGSKGTPPVAEDSETTSEVISIDEGDEVEPPESN